MCPRW